MLEAAQAIQEELVPLMLATANNSSPPPRHRHGRRRHARRRHLQEETSESSAVTPRTSPRSKAHSTLYVEEGAGYCGACGVDSLAGPGAASCETDCATVLSKMPRLEQLDEALADRGASSSSSSLSAPPFEYV